MSENNEQQMLNPQVAEVVVGIRSLRKVTVYPLSMADQLKLTDMISSAVVEQMSKPGGSDIALVSFAVHMMKENLGKILSMVTDEDGDALMSELTNLQAAELASLIYETNFGVLTKNYQSLVEKLKNLFPTARPLPQSANDIQVTD